MRMEVTWEQVATQPSPAAGERIVYGGESAEQFGVLRLPRGRGPYPTAVLVHGGCWLADYDYRHVEPLAAALTARGLATWVLEYRRIGQPGGGWPGTFLDVACGLDRLRSLQERGIDLERIAVVGHSAGGQLALWLGARPRVPVGSDVYVAEPLRVRAVVGLAAISDLDRYSLGAGECNAAVLDLMGGRPEAQIARYAAVNPLALAPLDVPVTLVHGDADATVPLEQSRRFAQRHLETGGTIELVVVRDAGHFDVIAPFGTVWPQIEDRIVASITG
jgi:acetyl esterase/lipase